MNVLHLNLKSCWYDLIEQGIKKEEYRELKPYWEKRLNGKHFDAVNFTYGYTKRNMTFRIESISIGKGKQEWGAQPGQDYFVIKIGDRLQ